MRLFDSSIFIGIFRGNRRCEHTLKQLLAGELTVGVSVITLTELYFGARCGRDPDHQIQRVDCLLAPIEVIFPIDRAIALQAAQIQAQLRSRNQMLDYRDLFIAATALIHRLPLRTLNTGHFERIDTLELDSWE